MIREHVGRRGYVPIWNTPQHSHHTHRYRLTRRENPRIRSTEFSGDIVRILAPVSPEMLPRVTAAVDEDVLAAS